MNDFLEVPASTPEINITAIYKVVEQNKSVDVIIRPDDKRTYTLITQNRIGCDACLLWNGEPQGIEDVTMTHFDPDNVQNHLRIIKERKDAHPKGVRRGVLLTRGTANDKWRLLIEGALKDYVGGKIDIIALSNLGLDEALEQIDPLSITKHTNYQLSFTRGYGGKLNVHKIQVEGSGYEKTFEF